ncbi:MAG TPA: efflux transporter periplasmic adaptor subunit, partial [Thauera aminoaromatica]|nr:efflux transporter periplasmic adaptor subunit [Thauera aminoaromatica]
MPSSRRFVLSLSLVGLAALGAYAWYANRPPALPPGGARAQAQAAGVQAVPPAAGTAGAKGAAGA